MDTFLNFLQNAALFVLGWMVIGTIVAAVDAYFFDEIGSQADAWFTIFLWPIVILVYAYRGICRVPSKVPALRFLNPANIVLALTPAARQTRQDRKLDQREDVPDFS